METEVYYDQVQVGLFGLTHFFGENPENNIDHGKKGIPLHVSKVSFQWHLYFVHKRANPLLSLCLCGLTQTKWWVTNTKRAL